MNRYLGEVARLAARRGVRSEETENGLRLKMDGTPLCEAIEDGSFRYRKQDAEDLKRSQMLHNIVNNAGVVKEYVSAMEAAPFLKATGLAEEKFKLLLNYGGYVLAGQDRGRYGFEFVTWERNWDGTAVGTGHYWEDNYRGAKEDFAVRSGLVDEHRLLNKDQSMSVYRLARHQLEGGIPEKQERELLEELLRKMEHSFPEFDSRYLIERLAADPRTGYTFVQGSRRTPYATGWFDEASGMYLSQACPEDYPDAKPFESPYDGLAALCREKIHLRDYEQRNDYPLTLQELPDAEALAAQLPWDYGANTGFLVDGLAFFKAVSEADEWLLCKQEDDVWQAMDHVSLHQILTQHGEDYFGRWMEALRSCPVSGYPEQMNVPDTSGPEQTM